MGLLLHADLLKEHLETVTALDGVAFHVDRKFDIREVAAAELAKKTKGAFCAISLGGWAPVDDDQADPAQYWATLRYEISFVTMPHILETLALPTFDVLLESLVVAINGWVPDGIDPSYCAEMKWRVGSGSYVPDDDYVVYLFPATFGEDFANPVEVAE
jgi:hypothetical protein